MGHVILGTTCFVLGASFGIAVTSLCVAAKDGDHMIGADKRDGCFGASFEDCDRCPKNGKRDGE